MKRRLVAALVVALTVGAATPAWAAPGPSDAPEWWFDTWNVQALWDGGARGQGVTIAEIDTGVNAALPELAGRVISGTDFGQDGGDGRTDHDLDPFGHGTAMASIMVAHPGTAGVTGLAPDARVLPIAVPINGTDDAPVNGNDQLPAAIRWAVDHGGKVISMSLGGSRDPDEDTLPCPTDEQNAINYALGKGAIVVAASGNSGQKGSPVEEPGVCLGVISVGAVDRTGQVADFSSRHPYLSVSAPGVAIASLSRVVGRAYTGDGTSEATAIASASLALIWSKYPKLTGTQVVARLIATLDHASPTRDPGYGYGIINPLRAITTNVPLTAPNPIYAGVAPFLAVDKARTTAPKAALPPPPTGSPGQFAVGSPPSQLTGRVVLGVVVAAVGLAGLLVLLIAGLARRRRYQRYPAYAGGGPGYLPDQLPPPPPTAVQTAGGEVLWHDVTGPIWPYPPKDRPRT